MLITVVSWFNIVIGLGAFCFGICCFIRGVQTEAKTRSVIEAAPDLWLGVAFPIISILPIGFGTISLLGIMS